MKLISDGRRIRLSLFSEVVEKVILLLLSKSPSSGLFLRVVGLTPLLPTPKLIAFLSYH